MQPKGSLSKAKERGKIRHRLHKPMKNKSMMRKLSKSLKARSIIHGNNMNLSLKPGKSLSKIRKSSKNMNMATNITMKMGRMTAQAPSLKGLKKT